MKTLRVALPVLALVLALTALSVSALAAGPVAAPAAVPASEGAFITATGVGLVAASTDPASATQQLQITAQSRADGDAAAEKAIEEMQARVQAIARAMEQLGIPAASVRQGPITLNATGVPPKPGVPSPVEKGQPLPAEILSYMIGGNLQVDVPARSLIAAMSAAKANGATQINSGYFKGPMQGPQPPAADIAKAIDDAVANARTSAEAMAKASGKKLGDVHSIAAQQPMPDCCPPYASGWRVQVTVTFAYAP